MSMLETLHLQHNAQYGLKWEDITEQIKESVLGRSLTKAELNRFVHKDIITVQKLEIQPHREPATLGVWLFSFST